MKEKEDTHWERERKHKKMPGLTNELVFGYAYMPRDQMSKTMVYDIYKQDF